MHIIREGGCKLTIYERIQIAAKKEHLSIRQLSKELGIGPTTIYKWAHTSPQIEVLIKVADRLNVSLDYLTGRVSKEDIKAKLSYPSKNDELIYGKNSATYTFDNTGLTAQEMAQIKESLEFAEKLTRHRIKVEKKTKKLKDLPK